MTASELRRLGPDATDDDYRRTKVGGRDRYSDLDLSRLRLLLGREVECDHSHDCRALAKVYRWILRGLPQYMAVKKVFIDREREEEKRAAADWESIYRELCSCSWW